MNFTKLTAAALAAGMALTAAPVFAAYSPNAADKPQTDVEPVKVDKEDGVNAFEVDGNTYVLDVQDEKDRSDAEKNAMTSVTTSKKAADNRMEIIKAAGYDTSGFQTTVVLGSGFYELVNDKNNKVVDQLPGGEAFTLQFNLKDIAKGEANEGFVDKQIFVMHFNDTKKAWEVKTAKVDEDGNFEVELNNLSPLAFVGALGWEGKDGRPAVSAPEGKDIVDVPTTEDGKRPSAGYQPGAAVKPAEKPVQGGTTSAGSTIANKVSPNTAA